MEFQFSRHGISSAEQRLQRALEILPGLTSWSLLLGMIAAACWKPVLACVLMVAFYVYWLLRLSYTSFFTWVAYLRLSIEQGTDWMQRIRRVEALSNGVARSPVGRRSWRAYISNRIHQRELTALRHIDALPPSAHQIYHVVLFPILREPKAIVKRTLDGLLRNTFPADQLLVILALEERAPDSVQEGIRELQRAYQGRFLDFVVVVHPDGLPGEACVKGANATFAAKEAARLLQARGIPFEHVVASCFDADTVVSPDYFACLTYYFMVSPDRTRVSFQPVPVYHNNFWEAPGFARVLETCSSFFQLFEATNPDKLVTFSSHSMSFKALVEVGFWPVDMISDDSAIFWKAFIHFDGRYRVIPLYVTVSMDIATGESWWQTLLRVYRQKRRWAWGVENFAIAVRAFLSDTTISWYDRFRYGFKLFETHVSWATWAFLLVIYSWFSLICSGHALLNAVFYLKTSHITALIFTGAFLVLCTMIALSLALLPPHRSRSPFLDKLLHGLEWLSVPFIGIFLSALPALEAQTRLMLGDYLERWTGQRDRRLLLERKKSERLELEPVAEHSVTV